MSAPAHSAISIGRTVDLNLTEFPRNTQWKESCSVVGVSGLERWRQLGFGIQIRLFNSQVPKIFVNAVINGLCRCVYVCVSVCVRADTWSVLRTNWTLLVSQMTNTKYSPKSKLSKIFLSYFVFKKTYDLHSHAKWQKCSRPSPLPTTFYPSSSSSSSP